MMPYPALLADSGKKNTRSEFNILFPEILTLAVFVIPQNQFIISHAEYLVFDILILISKFFIRFSS